MSSLFGCLLFLVEVGTRIFRVAPTQIEQLYVTTPQLYGLSNVDVPYRSYSFVVFFALWVKQWIFRLGPTKSKPLLAYPLLIPSFFRASCRQCRPSTKKGGIYHGDPGFQKKQQQLNKAGLVSRGPVGVAAAAKLPSSGPEERARGSRRSTSSSPCAPVCALERWIFMWRVTRNPQISRHEMKP